jgi:hypothetical protein
VSIPNIFFSLFIAVVSISLILGIFALSPVMFLAVAAIGSFFVVVFALPLILLIRKLNALNVYSSLVAGFFVGAVPFAIWLYPAHEGGSGGSTYSGIFAQATEDGAIASSAWPAYSVVVFVFGLIGILGASIFWLALTRLHENEH